MVKALAQLGDDLGIGGRYSELRVEWQRPQEPRPRVARLTGHTREILSQRRSELAQQNARDDRVPGVIVEADFENNSARVRTSDNERAVVTFSQEHADDIQAALRQPSQLEGRVTYDERTGAVVSLELRSIFRPRHLRGMADAEEFWHHRTVADLATEHGVSPIHDVDALAMTGATSEELDAFLDALTS